MGCGFAIFLDFMGARIIEHSSESLRVWENSFTSFAESFASFAVKIFNRKGRKGVAKFAKHSIHPASVQYVMF